VIATRWDGQQNHHAFLSPRQLGMRIGMTVNFWWIKT
jgi:hypothetical protein